jgi:ribosomal protein S18 acetylase RimI-like enzyme
MAIIRPYVEADRERVYDICVRTGDDGADATDRYAQPRLVAEIYAGPYLALKPELAWVIDAGSGAIGYVLGVDDTADFERESERSWWPALRAANPLDGATDGSPDRGLRELIHRPPRAAAFVARDYPAHLHVDLLPDAQGSGHGAELIATLCDALADRGIRGVHLGVSGSNLRAIGFYEHLGFTRLREEYGVGDDEWVFGLTLSG